MKKLVILLAMLMMSISVLAVGPGAGNGTPLDDDNDGTPNYEDQDYEKTYTNQDDAPDDDGDGIPNGQDDDYASAGTGKMAEFQNRIQELNQNRVAEGSGSGAKMGASGAIEGMKMMNQYTNSSFGKRVSEFAKNYENSNAKALQYEEKIQSRSGFSRFFMGGDKDTAEQLREQVRTNNQEIATLRAEMANADPEEGAAIQEQIQKLQKECDRLGQVADAESNKKGMFRWW